VNKHGRNIGKIKLKKTKLTFRRPSTTKSVAAALEDWPRMKYLKLVAVRRGAYLQTSMIPLVIKKIRESHMSKRVIPTFCENEAVPTHAEI